MATPLGQISPDGRWLWNGSQWVPNQVPAPQLSPDGRWAWNGTQWVPNAGVAGNPSGLVLFRGYCIFVACIFGGLGLLGFIGLAANGFDPQKLNTTGAALAITTALFIFGIVEAAAAVVAVVAPRRPWGWVMGLIVIILGMFGVTIVAAIPLLIYWVRAQMRTHYGMRA